uniref:TAFII28-like protein domain-containing protein n=1 Tax=Spongospora subterranea TaxID=70186 RepID=A0A0H5RBF8_9EUKA|eukprot:CRZ11146.1 hypothetical protein [Spongospora subterranea]
MFDKVADSSEPRKFSFMEPSSSVATESTLLPTRLIYNECPLSERKTIYANLSEIQSQRYEAFYRSRLAPSHVIMVMQSSLRTSRKPSSLVSIVMSGICKIFLSELMRKSIEIQSEWGHYGGIRPIHIREAYRRLHVSRTSKRRRELFLR